MAGTNISSELSSTLSIRETDKSGLALSATCIGTPPTTANIFQHGCLIIQTDSGSGNKAVYENTGTSASPSWDLVGSIASADIAAGAVTLAKLASGISPSHVIKFAGTASYGGGGTSTAITVTGAAATDIATAVIRASTNAVTIQKATLTSNTLTILFSADPGAGTTIDYTVCRAAA